MTRSLLIDTLGATALAVTVAGATVDLAKVGAITIRHGRQGAEEQPDASTCQLVIYADALPTLPVLGQPVAIALGASARTPLGLAAAPAWAAAGARFTGTITDLDDEPDAVGILGPGLLSITAVGPKARLGRIRVGDTPWPAELDGTRAGRILALAATAAGVTVGTVDPGTATVMGRDVDSQPALGLLDELASEAGGIMVSRRDGALEYHDAAHRRNVPPLLALTAANVLSPVHWRQQLGGMVNDLSLAYGPDGGSGQAVVRITDPPSITNYGPLAASLATQLSTLADARARATDFVGRRSRPRWRLDSLALDALRTLTLTQAGALAQVEVGALLTVTGFPSTGPYVTARLYVEGWTETWSQAGWQCVLDVTEYALTGTAPRWLDVPVAIKWNTAPTDLTWLAAAGWYPGEVPGGRWADISAGDQWTEIALPRTWATEP